MRRARGEYFTNFTASFLFTEKWNIAGCAKWRDYTQQPELHQALALASHRMKKCDFMTRENCTDLFSARSQPARPPLSEIDSLCCRVQVQLMYSNNNFNSKTNITRSGLMHSDHRQQKNDRKLRTERLTIINYYLLSLYFVKNTRSTRRAKDKMKLKAACCSSTLHCITPCLYYDQYIHPPTPPSLHESIRLFIKEKTCILVKGR